MADSKGLNVVSVREKALKKYFHFLRSWLREDDIFPLSLRGCSIDSSVPFTQRIEIISALSAKQKTETTLGYNLILETRGTRNEGTQTFLKTIEFPSSRDYLDFIGKTKEFSRFKDNVDQIIKDIPELEEWSRKNPRKILKYPDKWNSLIAVILYFRDEEFESATLRNLPIEVPTKFIENHQGILKELLDQVIPDPRINKEESDIALRYGLKKDDDFRFRVILPKTMEQSFPFRDIAVLPIELADWNPPVEKVLIIENKHSFLDIELPRNWLKIWGMGKGIIRLCDCHWLKEKKLFYWGDMDPQGFEILHLLRTAFSNTRSIGMELEDYGHFEKYAHRASTFFIRNDLELTQEEEACYRYLIDHPETSRIEQERVDGEWIKRRLV